MIPFEFALTSGAFAIALCGIAYVAFVVRTSGSDKYASPQRVKALVKKAPYDRLDNVLAKRR